MSGTTISLSRKIRPSGAPLPCKLEVVCSDVLKTDAPAAVRERILVVETDINLRSHLARELRASGYEVLVATTGEQAFYLLRDRQHPIDWLYTRASLPGLIDGWILADEHHDNYPSHPAVIAAPYARSSSQGHVVLQAPTASDALEAVRNVARSARGPMPVPCISATPSRMAA